MKDRAETFFHKGVNALVTLVFQKEFEEVLKEVSFAEGGRVGWKISYFLKLACRAADILFPFQAS